MRILAIMLSVLLAGNASAAIRYWNAADGDFQTAASWVNGAVPVANDSVIVTNGGTMRISTDVPALTSFFVGQNENVSNCVVQTGGMLQTKDNLIVGEKPNGRGYYHLSRQRTYLVRTLLLGVLDAVRGVCYYFGQRHETVMQSRF